MAKFTLQNGPVSLVIEDADCNVLDDVLSRYGAQFNIPATATAEVNGDRATGETAIPDGATVAFAKPTGQKGI
jgi:hypothetical protein